MKVDEQIPLAVFAHLLPLLIGAAENLCTSWPLLNYEKCSYTKTDVANHKKLVFAV
jgi:hypothetical protein